MSVVSAGAESCIAANCTCSEVAICFELLEEGIAHILLQLKLLTTNYLSSSEGSRAELAGSLAEAWWSLTCG